MTVPSLVPILSVGRHAGPEQGGCFMEVASLLAGERWSDHPRSVHPALGVVARAVNDATSDEARPALAPLVPLVVGTADADDRLTAQLVARCAERALPFADPVDRLLLGRTLRRSGRWLADRPARAGLRGRLRRWRLLTVASHAIPRAVLLLSEGAGRDTDAQLRTLLVEAITLSRRACGLPDAASDAPAPAEWSRACALLGTAEPDPTGP